MIKFRVWNKKTKSFIDDCDIVLDLISSKIYAGDIGLMDSVIDVTEQIILMQSTGLKDLKGVEIFEGDVVWIIDKGEMDNGWGWFEEVKFRNGSFMADDDFLINSHHRCVVRGNIYEQQELLGGQA
ncbi:YopX family protein [Enterococcus dispar]|uniref:YopX family protein n=1 Tax=Enterococcus dispar TaxID=44009 RepID=UPI0021D432B1|nr:YopX family protein [Enterococcus dispar]MCU7356713.1 YopX family protein [Enterococcus dispar]